MVYTHGFNPCKAAPEANPIILCSHIPKLKNPIQKLIVDWCKDDKGRNILYKNNGEERYPEFKLYKMIARTVHKHIPEEQVKNSIFNKFKTSTKKMNKSAKAKIINIDNLPSYINVPQETTEKKALSN